jgi:hypothetical protein
MSDGRRDAEAPSKAELARMLEQCRSELAACFSARQDLADQLAESERRLEDKLRAIRALADASRDARHGPGGCGIYARDLYAVLNGEKESA